MRSADSNHVAARSVPPGWVWPRDCASAWSLRPLWLADPRARFALTLCVASGCLLITARRLPPSLSSFEPEGILPGLRGWCALLAAVSVALRVPLLAQPGRSPHARRPAAYVRRAWLLIGAAAMVLGLTHPLRGEIAWIAQVAAAAAVFYGAGGVRWFRVVLPGLVLLAAPTLLGLAEHALAGGLQEFAAGFSEAFYGSVLSGQYEREGFSLRLVSAELRDPSSAPLVVTVAPECGGFRSFCGISIAALLFASHPALPHRRKLLVCLAAGVVAVGLNLSRLAVTLSLYHWGQGQLARGTAHALLSHAVLAAGVVCVYLTFRILLHLTPRGSSADSEEVPAC